MFSHQINDSNTANPQYTLEIEQQENLIASLANVIVNFDLKDNDYKSITSCGKSTNLYYNRGVPESQLKGYSLTLQIQTLFAQPH